MKKHNEQNTGAKQKEGESIPIDIINNENIEQAIGKEKEQTDNFDPKLKELEAEIVELKNKIKELETETNDLKDKRLRSLAEFENYKRRAQNELSEFFKYSSENVIKKILPVYDDLTRSLDHSGDIKNTESFLNGIKMVYDKFTKILEDEGVKKMDTKARQFDFNFHEALLQQPNSEVPNNTVLQEVEAGYMFKDKVLRHAKVIVSVNDNDNSTEVAEEKQ